MKIGLEIHQQLDTKKLFCSCESAIREDEPDLIVRRRQRISGSELGEYDAAAVQAAGRKNLFVYEAYQDANCLVELDDEPPHGINPDALRISLQASFLLDSKPVDELQVMRKIVLDGSNTSGFQRTVLVSTGGKIRTAEGDIGIQTICLEEDAARIIRQEKGSVVYRLDRLGIPLIEIATTPDIKTPQQAREVALAIGMVLRSCKVKRGLGTIRQDLNVSIPGGDRVEIKGVQDLDLIPRVAELEVLRQERLIGIRDELKKRGIAWKANDALDVSGVFSNSQSKIIKKALEGGGVVLAVRLTGFSGLLGKEVNPDRRFGTELSEYAKASAGVSGIFHSDELPAYGISEKEVSEVKEKLGLEEKDAFVLVADLRTKAERAIIAVAGRVALAFSGVPKETRKALETGSSSFLRPMPGAARMYPETDVPAMQITEALVSRTRKELPELIEKKVERISKRYGIKKEVAGEVALSPYFDLFEEFAKRGLIAPSVAASALTAQISALRRGGVPVENLSEERLREILLALEDSKFAKEALPQVITAACETGAPIGKILGTLGGSVDLEKTVEEVFEAKPELVKEKNFKPLMGLVMEKVRGKVDGRLVSEAVKKRLGL